MAKSGSPLLYSCLQLLKTERSSQSIDSFDVNTLSTFTECFLSLNTCKEDRLGVLQYIIPFTDRKFQKLCKLEAIEGINGYFSKN